MVIESTAIWNKLCISITYLKFHPQIHDDHSEESTAYEAGPFTVMIYLERGLVSEKQCKWMVRKFVTTKAFMLAVRYEYVDR